MAESANKSNASAPAAGSSNFFRRKKIIPPVVARKIGGTSKQAKPIHTTVKVNTANVSNNNEEQNVTVLSEQTLPVDDGNTHEKRVPEAEVSTGVSVPEERKNAPISNPSPPPSAKPATAFRRIKPKVAILPQLKPAKSILKKTNTISKETLPNSPVDTAGITASKEETAVIQGGEAAKDEVSQVDKEKMLTSIPTTPSHPTSHDKESIDRNDQKGNIVETPAQSVQQVVEEKTKIDTVSPVKENVVVTDLTEQNVRKENNSISDTSDTVVRIESCPPASDATLQDGSIQSIPEKPSQKQNTPIVTVAGTKTIKRAIPFGKLPADLTNLLKNHIKKKGKTVTAKDVSVPKPPPITEQRTETPVKELQENQENQKEVVNSSNVPPASLLVVEPANKETVENDPILIDKSPAKAQQITHESPVLENRPDNILNPQTKHPPVPAKPSAPPEASTTCQSSGVKKIQKVHKLTNETKLLLMNSLKKGKTKPPVKTPSAVVNASNVSNTGPLQVSIESAPVVDKKPIPSKDDRKVNIISSVVLPRLLNVPGQSQSTQSSSSFPSPPQQHILPSFTSNPTTPISIPTSSAPSTPQAQPSVGPPDNANQYPKVFIIGRDINATIPNAPSTISLPKPFVSFTVLPQAAGSSPDIPSSPLRHVRLPAPIVTVQRTTTPYTPSAPPSLPTPIVSVTMTPGKVNNETEPFRMDVPVDPRIVPKIVIEGCDSIDLDSQSSLSSTSSSSSSPNSRENQQQQRSEVGKQQGCSPTTLKMLRAKTLQNIKQKSERNLPLIEPPAPPKKVVRQYGNQSSFKRCVPDITITLEQAKAVCTTMKEQVPNMFNRNHSTATSDPERNASNLQSRDECNLASVFESREARDDRPDSAKSSIEQHFLEVSGFYGFSNASIEKTERDFEDRARTIDSILQAKRESSGGINTDEIEHNPSTSENVEEYPKDDSKNTFTNILATCSEASAPEFSKPKTASLETNASSEEVNSAVITVLDRKEENIPKSASLLPSETAAEDSAVVDLESEDDDHHRQDDLEECQHEFVEEATPPSNKSTSSKEQQEAITCDNNLINECIEIVEDGKDICNDATNIVEDVPMLVSSDRSEGRIVDESLSAVEVVKPSLNVSEIIEQLSEEPERGSSEVAEEQTDMQQHEQAIPVQEPTDELRVESPTITEEQKDKSNSVIKVDEPPIPVQVPVAQHPEEPKLASPTKTEEQKDKSHVITQAAESSIPAEVTTEKQPVERNMVSQVEDHPVVEVEEQQIPVPQLTDQETTTGVDFIIAMARMRRENRVLSIDDGSDAEGLRGMDDELLVTPGTPAKPSAPVVKKQKSKKKRKRRKRRRDEFVQLLLKHVNYESLIADVVQQEKQRFGYVSSSSESDEERSLSPLQRYIRGQERERQQKFTEEVVEVDVETDDFTTSSEGSLVEEKILSIFLNKESEESNSLRQQGRIDPGCSTSRYGVSAAQSEDPIRKGSETCDRSAYKAAEEITVPNTPQDMNEDVIKSPEELSNAPAIDSTGQGYDTTCDKINTANETDVKQFDVSTACENTASCDNTTSSAIVAKEEPMEKNFPLTTGVETLNTQMEKAKQDKEQLVQEQRLSVGRNSRKRSRVRVAKPPAAGRRMQPKRTKRNAQTATPPVEMPLFDSSDAPNNEVVSDCSTDGLSSTVEVVSVKRKESSSKRREVSKSRNCGRHSSSRSSRSSSRNSNSRFHAASGDDDLSSGGEPKMAKRRRLRRKKRSSLPVRNNLALKSTAFTVDFRSTDDPSVSATTLSTTALGSRPTDMSSHMSSTASKHSKASSVPDPAPTFVIPDRSALEEEPATARPREMIRVRNARALMASPPPPPEPPQPPQGQKRRRGRGAAAKQKAANGATADSNPNELITPTVPGAETEMVKCGYCQASTLPELWQEHYNYHNGATYRVGIDPPIDLKDIKAVSAVIQRFMKVQRRVEVQCERCGEIKKSGLGMASHLQACGLSERELEESKATCQHCGRKMKAVSIPIHQQQHCKVLKEMLKNQAAQIAADNTSTDETQSSQSGRKKRKSVATAERLIKKLTKEINEESTGEELVRKITGDGLTNFITQCCLTHLQQSNEGVCTVRGCAFLGMTEEKIRKEHGFQEDGTDPNPLYQCIKCTHMTVNESAIHEHIRLVHSDLMRKAALQHTGGVGSESDADTYVASGNGTTSDDSSVLDEEMDEPGGGKAKKGKGKKQSKKTVEDGGGGGKKATAKKPPAGGGKANLSDLLDGFVTSSTANDEAEVYKEMVYQESVDLKADRVNYHLMSVKWTHEFRKEHYAARLLFGDMRPDMDITFLSPTFDTHSYLPRTIRSMRYVQCNSKQYDPGYKPESFAKRWKHMGTFGCEALGCEQIFFTGGPVVSLDWLPLPDEANEADQFLAIACKQTYDEYYNCEELSVPQPRKCLVQVWNVGPLRNPGLSLVTARHPRLAFAIACDYGPIWQIAFCPSGCYNETAQGDDFDRLGLLAVAGSDGDVHLYALDRSMAVPGEDIKPNVLPRVLPLQPVMLLSLSLRPPAFEGLPSADFTGRSVLRIAWSREKGHTVLAAGYSNGVVAVWNLAAKSPLLCGTKDGIRTLLPVHKILHSSSSSITALDLHYSTGTRFLVVCNADRRLKIYDLRCGLYQPLETLSTTVRSRIPAIRWMMHFPVLVITYDDSLCIDRCAYTVHQPRDIGLRMFGIFSVGAEMTDLGPNDWLSMNAITTSGGDLICHRSVPFVFGMNYKKFAQILTTTISMKFKPDEDSADVSRYDAFSHEYGLLFSDTDKVPTAMDTAALQLKAWRRGKLGHYPAVRINQICWNPNSSSYSYYAIGYQAGFVRVRVLRT